MKGIPAQPKCGFSNMVVKILEMEGVKDYSAYDVLSDEELRGRLVLLRKLLSAL